MIPGNPAAAAPVSGFVIHVQIGRREGGSFQRPVELMSDCHRRIESFLATLQHLAEHASDAELTDTERSELTRALTYFSEAAPLHTQDEEVSLFPRLMKAAPHKAGPVLERLESDHRTAEAAHARVEALGQRWLGDGTLPVDDREALRGLLADLSAIYGEHIQLEDETLFPLATEVLDGNTLHEIGREMEARRTGLRGD